MMLPKQETNLLDMIFSFYDEEEEVEEEGEEQEEESEEEEGEEEGEEEQEEEETVPASEVVRLKASLRSERNLRREAVKREKALQARLERLEAAVSGDDSKKPPANKGEPAPSTEDNEPLIRALAKQAVDNTITRLAGKMGFLDVQDALALVDRKEIDVEQNDDDPTDVAVDEDSVTEALKKLARSKKHLIGETKTPEGSGSKMNAKKKGVDASSTYSTRFPALNR